jgi:hypothetical protein
MNVAKTIAKLAHYLTLFKKMSYSSWRLWHGSKKQVKGRLGGLNLKQS